MGTFTVVTGEGVWWAYDTTEGAVRPYHGPFDTLEDAQDYAYQRNTEDS